MRWLLHGNIQPAVAEALKRHKHETKTLSDIGLGDNTPADEILRSAHKNQLDLLTVDANAATSLYENPFAFDRSIVFLNVGEGDVERDDAIDRLFARYRHLTPGRLYTVTESRVKVRQLPSR
jgi:predicted nuclease of predicted toxin-antitoxin system